MTTATPSRDPADNGTLIGMVRGLLDKHLAGVDDMLPARVVSYDRANNRAVVAPLVKVLTTDGQQVSRATVASVPVMMFGGGGVALSFNLVPGNLGWIKASDRDISIFLRGYSDSPPNTLRKHSFQDAVFIPDVMHGLQLAPEDGQNAVLQTLNGQVRVSIYPDRVKLSAGALSVTVGPSTVDVVGHLNVPDGATISGIEFATHEHTGVMSGGANTGGPVEP